MKKAIFYIVLSLTILLGFTYKTDTKPRIIKYKKNDSCLVDSTSLNIDRKKNRPNHIDSLYQLLFTEDIKPNKQGFAQAYKGLMYFQKICTNLVHDTLALIDFTLSSNKERLWVIDLKQNKILYHELVAHGKNSGEEFPSKFSNLEESFQSSLGFYFCGDTYDGLNQLSLKLYGLESKFNGKAFDRGIVIHGANYVSKKFILENERLGRSLGCPAVRQDIISPLSNTIKNGCLLYIYSNNKSYQKYSTVLKQINKK